MTKFQIYSHYKLPITVNPLKYGKLLDQSNNKFIIQLTTKNVAVINHYDKENFIRIFKNGDLVLEYRDKFINENSFIRSINDTKFIFDNDKLISTEILTTASNIKIYEDTDAILIKNTPYNMKSFIKFLENTNIYKHKKAELFILFKLFLIFLLFFMLFYVFPEDSTIMSLTTFSSHNIIKLRKVQSKHNWKTLIFNVDNKIFSKSLFERIFSKFWKEIENKFTENNHIFILFKIKYNNGEFVSISKVQYLTINDKDWYIDWIINNMEFKSEYYNETQIDSIIFSYGFKKGQIENKNSIESDLTFQKYNNHNLVISFNPLDFGKILTVSKLNNETLYILQDKDDLIIKILSSENQNSIEIFKNAYLIIKFTDLKLSENKFIRIIDNKKYYFENNEEILFMKETNTRFISKTNKSKNLTNNFITLDIETYIKDNVLIPFCISFFDGKKTYSFFITDFRSTEDLILSALKSILTRKYNGYNVYMHNMAKFDIIFLLKHLVKLGSVNPRKHNDRFNRIQLNYGKNLEYRIQFKDSYLILLASLAKLTKGFMVKTLKSLFPFLFVNENNLDYIGNVPEFIYFGNKTNYEEYKEYYSKFNIWNLKEETIKYCEIDCISLHQVIFKFSELIFDLFQKNVHHYPTLPSLAFAIFRSNFMKEKNISQLSGKISKDIRSGYTGGAVDMYIPENPEGEVVYAYDVNSLYPFIMKEYPMPTGKPVYFEGDIRAIDPNAFGFFYCEIIAPLDIKHPILQTHVKTNGIRTIAPIGTWEDMIFSAEMDNAIKYGYKFKILWGYTFKPEYLFKDYVDFLYNFRINYHKSDPLNFIAKILLNSLYGRFGMNDNFTEINIIHKDYLADFENKFLNMITNKTELDDYFMVEIENFFENDESTHNINVGIAAAITAYARIHMSQFKNNPNFELFYSDTDSIYINKPLDKNFISENMLGKMKLEYILKKAIFLSPKVYYLETINGKVIYKVKGLKHEVELNRNNFEFLLGKNAFLLKNQTKWFRNLSEGEINILEQIYTLKVTENKRKLIFKKSKLVNTKPFKINKNKSVINDPL